MISEKTAKKLETDIEWNGRANVCVHCGRVPETFYVATGHDHTDYDIRWCPCREPNPTWCAGCSPDNCSGCGAEPVAYITPQPDRTAELEQLRQQVADLEKERDELIEVKAAENASWNAGFNVQVDQLKKLTAERDAALNEARDFESDVDTVTQHNVELQLETIALKSALNVARDALIDCEGALDECRDYPITYDTILEALAKINEVLK